MERALLGEYRTCIEELLRGLTAENLARAVQIARIPEDIRGYGHVKLRHVAAARVRWDTLMTAFRGQGEGRGHAGNQASDQNRGHAA